MIEPAYPAEEASGIWVFLEHDDGALVPVSLELLARARTLAGERGTEVVGLLLGHEADSLAAEAAALDLDRVVYGSHPLLADFTSEAWATAAAAVVMARKPDIFLLGATPYGRDVAGRLGVMLKTGLTADCTDLALEPETGLLLGEVSGFGGGILAMIKCEHHRPQMATVRPGVFADLPAARDIPAPIERFEITLRQEDCPVRVVSRHRMEGVDLSKAERLVVAGAGTRGDMPLMQQLAAALEAELGATRPAVDEGWTERERQIGQTGVITRPKLAVVCGVSGATQFTVGIEGAGLVVAVNQDPEAPIFEQADLCVIDDLFPVVRALVAEFESNGRSE